jgi:hypothetical protein
MKNNQDGHGSSAKMGLVMNIKIKRLIQIYKTWQTHKYKQHLDIRKKIPWAGLEIYNSEEQLKKWQIYIWDC